MQHVRLLLAVEPRSNLEHMAVSRVPATNKSTEISAGWSVRYSVMKLLPMCDCVFLLQHALSRKMPFDQKITPKDKCIIMTFKVVYFVSDSCEEAKVKSRWGEFVCWVCCQFSLSLVWISLTHLRRHTWLCFPFWSKEWCHFFRWGLRMSWNVHATTTVIQ